MSKTRRRVLTVQNDVNIVVCGAFAEDGLQETSSFSRATTKLLFWQTVMPVEEDSGVLVTMVCDRTSLQLQRWDVDGDML